MAEQKKKRYEVGEKELVELEPVKEREGSIRSCGLDKKRKRIKELEHKN